MGAKNLISGSAFRSMLNDLKRRPEDAALELGVREEEIHQIIVGEKALTPALIEKAALIWPVNQRDFYRIEDDCPEGVLVMDAADSEKSNRVMKRGGKPYYEYMDTAMSRVSFFRPEWIKELCVVDDDAPNNDAVQWNNGHFLHQFTYFIGPVNFYYRGDDGTKQVAVMDTGDSMYITPFVPHSFATRANKEGKKGIILALTYGNKLSGDTHQELAALGQELVSQSVPDFSSREEPAGVLLRYYRELESVTLSELSRRTSIDPKLLHDYEKGRASLLPETLASLAKALKISPAEFYPPPLEEKVIVQKYKEASSWNYPDENPAYRLVELAGTSRLPHSKSLEITVMHDASGHDFAVPLHQYGYTVGDTPVKLQWRLKEKEYSYILQPDSSFYIKPSVEHGYSGTGGKLLVLRIGGRIAGEAMRELSVLGKDVIPRIVAENQQWYDPQGKKEV